jgi:hypothetical protein
VDIANRPVDPSIGSEANGPRQPDSCTATLPAIHQRLPEERTMHPYLAVILSERTARRHADLRAAR